MHASELLRNGKAESGPFPLVPEIEAAHLTAAPAGVRAQALLPDGSLVDDFLIETHSNIVNVLNAPSPAATSALTIGDSIVERLAANRG